MVGSRMQRNCNTCTATIHVPRHDDTSATTKRSERTVQRRRRSSTSSTSSVYPSPLMAGAAAAALAMTQLSSFSCFVDGFTLPPARQLLGPRPVRSVGSCSRPVTGCSIRTTCSSSGGAFGRTGASFVEGIPARQVLSFGKDGARSARTTTTTCIRTNDRKGTFSPNTITTRPFISAASDIHHYSAGKLTMARRGGDDGGSAERSPTSDSVALCPEVVLEIWYHKALVMCNYEKPMPSGRGLWVRTMAGELLTIDPAQIVGVWSRGMLCMTGTDRLGTVFYASKRNLRAPLVLCMYTRMYCACSHHLQCHRTAYCRKAQRKLIGVRAFCPFQKALSEPPLSSQEGFHNELGRGFDK